ncbi:MAG: hypothetical protein KIH01_06060 [Candidatus Freyarchaeota archaeon]|nr:hypothetical protein [Candidatus Jordarchaeia archaeon]
MSFILDVFLLLGIGMAISWLVKRKRINHLRKTLTLLFSVVTIAVFYTVAIPLYVNNIYFPPYWMMMKFVWSLPLPVFSFMGRDFMINSGVLQITTPNIMDLPASLLGVFITDPTSLGLAIVLFALYPFWLYLGILAGRFLFGSRPEEKGMLGAF